MNIVECCLMVVLSPLWAALGAGFGRTWLGKVGAHTLTISGVLVSFIGALYIAYLVFVEHQSSHTILYTWGDGGALFNYAFHLGFMIDPLSAVMLLVVTFVSLLVHIYSIGYMAEDAGYQRFFSYISLFTFMMLVLVTSNNFLQLFFGWEGVGLVSYLLIGFWYEKETAIAGSLKAFVVNRFGDFGFILGIGLLFAYVGSLDYTAVFAQAQAMSQQDYVLFEGTSVNLMTLVCCLLFVGAMGKSAQVPLHVWLPESMEGPTPISALIHAATMVTAGVFMLARISPMIEYSETALSVVLIIGATGALFTGLLGLVMNDIKRVVAYSTLSQLGYMMVAMGVSAFSAGMFHLMTHACFKALLFLGAGSVIVGMHHEQDMRKMGGLWKKMPLTYVTFLIGTLALCAIPPFSGFYSKDTIIEAAQQSTLFGAQYAYYCVLIGALITALYSFRAFFMTFHGTFRSDEKTWAHVHESPMSIVFPLVVLAIPSIILGGLLYRPMLFDVPSLLSASIVVHPAHDVLSHMAHEVTTASAAALHALYSPVFALTCLGIVLAWVAYVKIPRLPEILASRFSLIYRVLVNKYGFDQFNDWFWVKGSRQLGRFFYEGTDQTLIDGLFVNGSAKLVARLAVCLRKVQSGYLYEYAGIMVIGVFGFLCWLLF